MAIIENSGGPCPDAQFVENPSAVVTRDVRAFPYPQDDTLAVITERDSTQPLLGTQPLLSGSDWPHPWSLCELADLPNEIDDLHDATKRAFSREDGTKIGSGVS